MLQTRILPVFLGMPLYDTNPAVTLVLLSEVLFRMASWKRNCVCGGKLMIACIDRDNEDARMNRQGPRDAQCALLRAL